MAATALYEKLKKDPNAIRVILIEITGKKPDGTLVTARIGDEGWNTDADETPSNTHFHRALLQGLNLSSSILQGADGGGLEGGVGIPTYGAIEWFNRDGFWDAWADYSVDGQTVRALMVGWLGDGTRVRYSDAISEPILTGIGVDRPNVGDTCRVAIRSRLGLLEQDAQPLTFAPPCPVFPGSSTEYLDFGDVLDLPAGSWTIEGWFYTEDPNLTGQYLVMKDNFGASGWGVELGTAGAGTIRGYVREQANNTTASATGLVKPRRWTHFALRFDSAASTRTLLLDGTAVTTTASVTGNATNTTAPFRIGWGLQGRVSWLRIWSTARSDATIRAEMYLPQLPGASGLFEDLPLDEGRPGLPIRGRKTGSTTSGAATSSVTWGSATWIGASLAGQHRRLVLGKALEVELVPRDPVKKVYEAALLGTVQAIGTPSSNGNNLAGGTFTVDTSRGLVSVAAGTDVGRMTADVTGIVPWGYAGLFDGVDDVGVPASNVTCPAGSMAVAVLASTPTYAAKARALAGWRNGGGAGFRTLYFGSSLNTLVWEVRNDTGASFTVTYGPIQDNTIFFAEGVLDVTAAKIRLYYQGLEVASAAVSGTFNTVSNAFAVGRLSDLALFYHDGLIDAVYILNRVPTATEAATIALRELTSSAEAVSFGAQDAWLFNEGSGTSVANLVTGRPALTLTGATFTTSRHAHVDLILYLLGKVGITTADLNVAKAAAFLRDVPGQAFRMIDGDNDSDILANVNALLRGVRAALVESGATFVLDLLRLPEGASVGTFTERHCTEQPIEPEPLGRTIWGMDVFYGRCHTPLDAEDVASTVAANDPERFRFLTADEGWQVHPKRDGSILSDYPGAEIAIVRSHLLLQRDAQNLGNLLLPIHGPRQFALNVQIDTENPALAILGEFNLNVTELDGAARFGGNQGYRIVSIRKEETIYTFVIWRKRT